MSHCQYVTVAVTATVQSELFCDEKLFSIYFKQDPCLMHKTEIADCFVNSSQCNVEFQRG